MRFGFLREVYWEEGVRIVMREIGGEEGGRKKLLIL